MTTQEAFDEFLNAQGELAEVALAYVHIRKLFKQRRNWKRNAALLDACITYEQARDNLIELEIEELEETESAA